MTVPFARKKDYSVESNVKEGGTRDLSCLCGLLRCWELGFIEVQDAWIRALYRLKSGTMILVDAF